MGLLHFYILFLVCGLFLTIWLGGLLSHKLCGHIKTTLNGLL